MDDDDDDDIFNMLLMDNKRKATDNSIRQPKTRKVLPDVIQIDSEDEDDDVVDITFDLKASIDSTLPFSSKKSEVESRILEYVYDQDIVVLSYCCDENMLYVLVEESNETAVVHIYHLDLGIGEQPKLVADFSSMMSSHLFGDPDKDKPDYRRMYIINQQPSHNRPDHSDSVELSSTHSGKVYLPSATFASLFGKKTSLIKSPVIVLCTKDGCVYWRPVKSVSGREQKFTPMCHLHDAACSILLSFVGKTSSIDEEVAKSLYSALSTTEGASGDRNIFGLLIVNTMGECCLLLPRPDRLMDGSSSWFDHLPLKFYLPHPVVCCVQQESQFIYSTGWSVESVRLCLKQEGNVPTISLDNQTTLMAASIQRLYFKTTQDGSDLDLFGLTSDLDAVHVPTRGTTDGVSPMSASHLLPDTIQRIQQHTACIQQLQDRSRELDSHLTQLNVLSTLRQQYQNRKKHSDSDKKSPSQLIQCNCIIDNSQGYNKTSEIRIQLRNNCGVDLSNDWSVLVTCYRECFLSEEKVFVDSICFKIETGFGSNCLKTFSFPLKGDQFSDQSSMIRVKVSLVLCVTQDAVCGTSMMSSHCDNKDSVLEVEIHSQAFDYLHFMRVCTENDLSAVESPTYSIEYLRKLLERLRERKLKVKAKSQIPEIIPDGKKMVSRILVPDLIDQKSQPEPKEEVLKLLSQNIIKIRDDITNTPISALCQSPTGKGVCFTLEIDKSRQNTIACSGKKCLQLILESSDVTLLCVVHIALLKRFKIMTKAAGKASSSKIETQIHELKAAKASLHDITKSRNEDDDEMISSLCNVLDCLGKCVL